MSTLNVEFLKQENSSSNNVTLDSDGSVAINRHTSDGTVIDLQKDGTSVGSIQSRAGLVTTYIFDPRTSGAGLTGGGQAIFPTDETGALEDATITLGGSSTRFNNLYLSGGVYLGGTTSANYLTDYEEGTWTIDLDYSVSANGGLTFNRNTGQYIKIGDMVHISAFVSWTANNFTSSSGDLILTGLPFTTNSTQSFRGGVSITYSEVPWTGVTVYSQAFRTEAGLTRLTFNRQGATDGSMAGNIVHSNISSSGQFMISGAYRTA